MKAKEETIYLNPFNYKQAKVLKYLLEIIIKNGGRLLQHTYGSSKHDIRKPDLYKISAKSSKEVIPKTQFLSNVRNYMSFVIPSDNKDMPYDYFYIQTDDNMFFPTSITKGQIQKHHIKDSFIKVSADYYGDDHDDAVHFDTDYFFSLALDDDVTLKEVAKDLYNTLISLNYSKKHVEYERQEVQNIYDNGHHMENVPKRERLEWYRLVDPKELV